MEKKAIKKIADAVCIARIGQCLLVKSILINELCIIFKMYNVNFDDKKFQRLCNRFILK